MGLQVSDAAIAALCEKYREMQRLRIEHVAGEPADPRPRLRALSSRFPGSLRELDELPMEQIERRLATIEGVLAGTHSAPDWIALQLGYHGLMRAALCIKRIVAEGAALSVDGVLELLPTRYLPASHEPPLEALDRVAVAAILDPVDGRLNPWVYARVAAAAGVEPDVVRRALFMR